MKITKVSKWQEKRQTKQNGKEDQKSSKSEDPPEINSP
jgi:hypothetical protein